MSFVKSAAAGAVMGGSMLFGPIGIGLGAAQAQPAVNADGLVNVAVGDLTLMEGVATDTAATAAGALCGAVPADATALATQVDGDGVAQVVCPGLPGGDLIVAQNVAVSAPAPAEPAPAPAEQVPAPAEEAPAPEGGATAETGTGEGLGAPEGTGSADGGEVPLPSQNG